MTCISESGIRSREIDIPSPHHLMEFWSPDFRTVGREMRRPPYYGLGAVFLEREERRRRPDGDLAGVGEGLGNRGVSGLRAEVLQKTEKRMLTRTI